MRLLLLALLALGLPACIIVAPQPRHRVVYCCPHGRVVVVEHTHVCHAGCAHYWYHGQWYVIESHRHGPHCGHHFWGGRWWYSEEVVVEEVHVHNANCGHYWCDGRWYFVEEHVHSPGCGHEWRENRWVLVIR